MASRRRLAAVAIFASVLMLPSVAAHSIDQSSPFNPLEIHLDGRLGTEGRLLRATSEEGRIAFPATDTTSGSNSRLEFSFVAPVTFAAASGFHLDVRFEADRPFAARGPDGNSFEFALLANGTPIDGAVKRVATSSPLLIAGGTESVDVRLQAASAVLSRGTNVTLAIRVLAPVVAADTLFVRVGTHAIADFEIVRVPTVAHLDLDEGGLLVYHLVDEAFVSSDPNARVIPVSVGHDVVRFGAVTQPVGTRLFLVFRGDENPVEARTHGHPDAASRNAAAHEFFVGAKRVLVHPGVGVVVPVTSDVPTTIAVRCGVNCPEPGFSSVITFRDPDSTGSRGPPLDGGLIPPPRDTSGIPKSQDAPETRGTPGAGAALALVAVVLAAMRRRV